MLNQVSAEAVYSATYVENYLDGVENLPNELQRLISRMRELDVCYLARVREAAFYQQSCKRIGNDNPTKKARNILRMQQSLIAAQELGDEKMSLLQAILDQIEAKTRLLDQHFKNLDFGKEDAVQIENKEPPHHHQSAAGVTTTTTNSNNNNNNNNSTGNILTNNERPPNKRARRARHDTFSGLESNSSHHQNDTSATTAAAVATATASSAAAAVAATAAATPAAVAPVEHVLRSSQAPSSATAAAAAATAAAAAAAAVVSTASTTAASTNNTSTSGGTTTTTTNQKKTTTGKKKKRKAKQTAHAQKEAAESPPRDEEPLIDPDEPTYCLCDQISYGEMIMCDNDLCPIEWFHFSCVTLTTKPKGKWYCPKCRGDRPNVMKPKALFLRELEKYNKDKEEKT